MKKLILIAFVTFLMVSCRSTKKLLETDNSTKQTTTERSSIVRPGDTIRIDIPNIRYKDTLIRRTNYETKSVATVYYDKDGNQRFECQSAELRELKEIIIENQKNNIKKDNESKTEFNPQYFIYALAIFAIIICILFYMIIRIQKNVPVMTATLVKEIMSSK